MNQTNWDYKETNRECPRWGSILDHLVMDSPDNAKSGLFIIDHHDNP